ncbi:MAG TPA: redoxin domain-containing protein [Planctomycetaceae bacterium]|nr:redoxin domain-containing protein [Planctomycetaceae bacterium]
MAIGVATAVWLCAVSGCGERHPASPRTVGAGAAASPQDERAQPAPAQSELVDIAGEIHHPFGDPQVRAVALVFLVPDCPIANSYAPELNRLLADYKPRGVRLFLIQVDPDLSLERAREHARDYQLRAPVVLDGRHDWARQTGATMTPEVAVLSPAGELFYRGRIDDRYVKLGQRRSQATSHDLRDALEAILEGRPVMAARTVAVGCPLPNLGTED